MKIPVTQSEIREMADVIRKLLASHTNEGERLQRMRRVVIASCNHPDKVNERGETRCLDCLWTEAAYR